MRCEIYRSAGVAVSQLQLVLDHDVEKVLDFMAREIRGDKLLFVARAIAQVAELAWADAIPSQKPRNAISMSPELKIEPPESRTRLVAT